MSQEYTVCGHYLFREIRFEGQIVSKDKYPSTFSHQIEAMVFIINNPSNIFRNLCSVENGGTSHG